MRSTMRNTLSRWPLAALCVALGAWTFNAVAAEEMTIDEYIADAGPYLHHSCESAWAVAISRRG